MNRFLLLALETTPTPTEAIWNALWPILNPLIYWFGWLLIIAAPFVFLAFAGFALYLHFVPQPIRASIAAALAPEPKPKRSKRRRSPQ